VDFFTDKGIVLSIREDKARRNLEDALKYYGIDRSQIAETMGRYFPLEVLKTAVWEERRISSMKEEDAEAKAMARFFPLLLQSVTQDSSFSFPDGYSENRGIKSHDWNRLKKLVQDAFKRLVWYIENYASLQIRSGKVSERHYEEYRDQLFYQLFSGELQDDAIDLREKFISSLAEGSEKFASGIFGTDEKSLSENILKLCDTGRNGPDRLVEEWGAFRDDVEREVERISSEGDERPKQEIWQSVVSDRSFRSRHIDIRGRLDGYGLFSVEANTDLPLEAMRKLSLNVGSCNNSDFTELGGLTPVFFPFIRFQDHFYTFVGRILYLTYPSALRRIMHDEGYSFGVDLKTSNLLSSVIGKIFNETDGVDTYTWRGHLVDIAVMTNYRYINGFKYPDIFEERVSRRDADMQSMPQPGHKMLIVDPMSTSELHFLGDDRYFISLKALWETMKDDERTKKLYISIFSLTQDEFTGGDESELEELLDDGSDDIAPEEESDEVEAIDETPEEKVEEELLSEETEYDKSDDDELMKEFEREEVEEVPANDYSDEYEPKSDEEKEKEREAYELPESLLEDDKEELVLSALETDEYSSPEEEAKEEEYVPDAEDEEDELPFDYSDAEIQDSKDSPDDLQDDIDEEEETLEDELELDDEYDDSPVPQSSHMSSYSDSFLSSEERNDGQMTLFNLDDETDKEDEEKPTKEASAEEGESSVVDVQKEQTGEDKPETEEPDEEEIPFEDEPILSEEEEDGESSGEDGIIGMDELVGIEDENPEDDSEDIPVEDIPSEPEETPGVETEVPVRDSQEEEIPIEDEVVEEEPSEEAETPSEETDEPQETETQDDGIAEEEPQEGPGAIPVEVTPSESEETPAPESTVAESEEENKAPLDDLPQNGELGEEEEYPEVIPEPDFAFYMEDEEIPVPATEGEVPGRNRAGL